MAQSPLTRRVRQKIANDAWDLIGNTPLVQLNKGDKDATIKALEKVIASDPASPEAAQAKQVIEQLKK